MLHLVNMQLIKIIQKETWERYILLPALSVMTTRIDTSDAFHHWNFKHVILNHGENKETKLLHVKVWQFSTEINQKHSPV